MKNIILVSIIILVFFSCKKEDQKIIHYEFEEVKVSRYDLEKRTYLYYGDCNNVSFITKNVSVIIDWQFDDFLQAALIFREDGKVEIMSGGAELEKMNQKNEIYFKDYESPEYNRIMDKHFAPNNAKNLCHISDNTQFELEENKKFKSDVAITHQLQNDKIICP